MRRSKREPYWAIKEDNHFHHEWVRQNRKVSMRLHLSYDTIQFTKIKKPYIARWKHYDRFRLMLRRIESAQFD